MSPRVTAIITTFNRRQFLPAAIKSVLAQTFPHFELLILDNGSTDDTAAIVRGFQDPRIRYIHHQPMTIGAQRNLGVAEAQSEFIAFLDDDDEWMPGKLAAQISGFMHRPNIALVYGGFFRIDAAGQIFAAHTPTLAGDVLMDLLWQRDAFTGSASNPMLLLSAVKALGGYDPALTTGEDWELYLRLAEEHSVAFVSDQVVRIRSHRGPRLGDRLEAAAALEARIVARYRPIMPRRLVSRYYQKIGGKYCRLGTATEGRKWLRDAITVDPSNLGAYLQYAASFTGAYTRAHRIYKALERRRT